MFPAGIWAVDFEFHPAHGHEGDLPKPVCMVARELTTNRTMSVWQDDLMNMRAAPFPVDRDALFVRSHRTHASGALWLDRNETAMRPSQQVKAQWLWVTLPKRAQQVAWVPLPLAIMLSVIKYMTSFR